MNTEICRAAVGADCPPESCHRRCAIEVIDELLCLPKGVSGQEADLLLDLRWQLSRQDSAEETLRAFARVRLQLEAKHYLALFRIRRWLENNIVVHIQGCMASEAVSLPVKLDAYCLEAVRRQCLCRGIEKGVVLLAPRLKFAFRLNAPFPQAALSSSGSLSIVGE